MRTVRTLTAAVALAGVGLFAAAGAASAASPSPAASGKEAGPTAAGPTEAGTTFRTAAALLPGQEGTADASVGDYLYWAVPLDSGQRATVTATVKLPPAASRHGSATWRLDVYDGLRRRQACMYGMQTRAAAKAADSVELSCTLRPVRAGAEPWANDPLPGSYYVRLTVSDAAQEDLGQPVRARVRAAVKETGGALAVDAALAAPLTPPKPAVAAEPEGGWSGGWWSDRWVWTAAGGLLAALAGIGGYALTRGTGRPSRVPPGA
ncbi:hypothetical protein MTF65_22700 [Streptomyces sp. APSN-46.1]|uniref:hypothetical protein n=1 Tax=Streptomyces sp. APSN-46.1 TaxID=2929049 RepID=UPI001FB1D329|nr:hypothetical protein [Streptomyces sp. APSN-46.1]MCJ1680098.1 hypothetical protein [Streptomyces sp. APSN-46.1]